MPTRTMTVLIGVVATILLGWVVHSAAGILQPLVIALLLCSMLQPIVSWLAKRHIPPPVTVLVLVTILLLAFARTGVWVRTQVEQFVGTRPIPTAPKAPGSGLSTSTLDPASPFEGTGLGLEGVLDGRVDDQAAEPSEPQGEGLASGADAAESTADDPGTAEVSGGLVTGTDSLADPVADPGTGSIETPETAASEETLSTDSDGVANAEGDAAEEDEEQVQEVGWAGIRAFLEQRLNASNLPEQMTNYLKSTLRALDPASFVYNVLGTTLGFSRGLLLVVIYMLFIFAEQAIFRSKILAVAGEHADDAAETLDSISRGIQRYLSVKTVVSLATGILCYSVLEGLRVPYAPLFGFLTFLLNFIPTFGSIAAGALATITAFASKGSWESVAIVFGTYLAVNMFLGSYIEPRILGRELNLSPLVILVSVVVWAGLWGVAGTFLAVPLTATIQIILANNDGTRPIAILLSSGPPREGRRAKRAALREAQKVATTEAP